MYQHIYRFIFKAHPSTLHPKYFTWQVADTIVLVGENYDENAMEAALSVLESEKWVPEQTVLKDRLIAERVEEEGGEIWEAYQSAEAGTPYFHPLLDGLAISTKQQDYSFSPPRIDESFIDRVIETAGGHRVSAEEANNFDQKNADYLLGGLVLELKDLQNEGLQIATRQDKLAKLFEPYGSEEHFQCLDPSVLSADDLRSYMNIVGTPIQNCIKIASKQIKSTMSGLKSHNLKGGVILLNTGYLTLPHKTLTELGRRYATKDTSVVSELISISSWTHTNGFDTYCHFSETCPHF